MKKYYKKMKSLIIITGIISALCISSCTARDGQDDIIPPHDSVSIKDNETDEYPPDTGEADTPQRVEIHEYPDFYAVSEYYYLSDTQKALYDICAEIYKEQISGKEYLFDKVSWYDFKIVQNILMANFSPFEELFSCIMYMDNATHQKDLTIYGLYLYKLPGSAWDDMESEYEAVTAKAEEILSEITYDGTEADLAYKIAQWLVENVVYFSDVGVSDNPKCNTSYGALINNLAVCDGYAKAYDFLCKKAGLESIYITGERDGWWHAWNMVKIDGKWFHFDTTWMSVNDMTTYFMMDSETAYRTHYNPCYYFNPVLYKSMMPSDDD